jgi:hypothetical protein
MLLRVDKTTVVNLQAYKRMNLSDPVGDGMYCIEWWRSGEGPFSLEVAKDQAVAQKVFNMLVSHWAGESRLVEWADLMATLFESVKLPRRWAEVQFSVRDAEPRVLVGRAEQYGSHRTSDRVLSSKQMRELIVAMQTCTSWPPSGDTLWAVGSSLDDEGDNFGDDVTRQERAELIRTLEVALKR